MHDSLLKEYGNKGVFRLIVIGTRAILGIIVVVLVIAGVLVKMSIPSASSPGTPEAIRHREDLGQTGGRLFKAGYCLIVFIYAILLLSVVIMWSPHLYSSNARNSHKGLKRSSVKILIAMSVAAPFLLVRDVAGMMFAFQGENDDRWMPINFRNRDAIAITVVMDLICEYVVVWAYVGAGYWIPATRGLMESEGGPNSQDRDNNKYVEDE